jgi:DeoR family suf operon transcriptional repressor
MPKFVASTRSVPGEPLPAGDDDTLGPLPLLRGSDESLVELLRGSAGLAVPELTEALGVTATAVRQRLRRLMEAGVVVRQPAAATGPAARGRPSHVYLLSSRGARIGGDNFRDLAMVLWREVRLVDSPDVRRGLLSRIGQSLAETCRNRTPGQSFEGTPVARLRSVAAALQDRKIACECSGPDNSDGLAVLTTHTCPYPQLAETDRGICAAERVMLEELVAAPVRLTECRLDGASCCRFTVDIGEVSGRRQKKEVR